MSIYFILTEPAVPENIGAAARAMKTMGFNKLRLINPCNHLSNEAKWLAHASHEVLETAEVFNSFENCIKDLDFIIGTSAKKRSVKYNYYTPKEVTQLIQEKKKSIQKIGVVFGKEESGLKNNELSKCDIISSIPLIAPYPSLNLSQSVMLFAYELSSFVITKQEEATVPTDKNTFRTLKEKASIALQMLGFKTNSNIYNRINERINHLGSEDINLTLSVLSKIIKDK